MQHCDSTCFHCAQTFFLWLKNRLGQFERPRGARAKRSGDGNWNEAAATSVRPPRPMEACTCDNPQGAQRRCLLPQLAGEVTVLYNAGHVGLDGRHWLKVKKGSTVMQVHCSDLTQTG